MLLQVLLLSLAVAAADKPISQRGARQLDGGNGIVGAIDFSGCETDPDTGFCCIEKEETVTSLQKDPILECTHKQVEKCHYTYVTQFQPAQEEICEENFEKTCQVTFKQQALEENVKKCYRPLTKVCNGQGPEECRTVYESSCTTRYIEKQPGRFVGDTTCEKLPVEICGAGCITEEGEEECHDKTITSLVDVPEETCDLNPQTTCRLQTKLVPSLAPKHECTIIPQEVCNMKFSPPELIEKPLLSRWCLDPAEPTPGESYEESNQTPPVITEPPETASERQPQPELPGYEPPQEPTGLYDANEIRGGRSDPFLNQPIQVDVPAVNGFFQGNDVQQQQAGFRQQQVPVVQQQQQVPARRQRTGRRQRFGARRNQRRRNNQQQQRRVQQQQQQQL